ncbi:polysaccharide deacetylase family protein [Kitasatospora sp. NBC_01246]|uniref:polysaccharide deacetylase family protein n=1 Tax=Kitasatospora sp. NBC_01246 TaxID=2903570 RepID=UPI002E2EBDCE|nr:polysaccharide deacetylase family protein [Kitasatospora sp. NBC_01246]
MRRGVRMWPVVLGVCAALLAPGPVSATPATHAPTGGSAPAGPDCERLACVALTFDDGPSAATAELLDDLAAARVKATFFAVGDQVRWWPDRLRREAAEGHVIGNHSLTHPRLGASTPAQVRAELAGGEQAIAEVLGERPELVRPPYGSFSAEVRRFGHPLVLWDIDTRDWDHHDPAQVLARVEAGVRPGSVILMHDTENQRETLAVVPELVRRLRGAGYTLVTVPELFAPATLVPGGAYRDRASAVRPVEHPQPWDTAPASREQDSADAVAGTLVWQHPTGAPDGAAEAETVESGLRPGECRTLVSPGPPAYAVRNLTGHDIELHDRPDCTRRTGTVTPGEEIVGELYSVRVL